MAQFYLDACVDARPFRVEEEPAEYGEKRYPVGYHTFAKIREKNLVYVDKTEYVYRMTHSGMKSVYLSRPRRFGKSLLLSTLGSYFEGRRELFSGLEIDRMENKWKKYPVLQFDMSNAKGKEGDALDRFLMDKIEINEARFGLTPYHAIDPDIRFYNLIRRVCEKEGSGVVVLVDEYDAPMLDVINDEEKLQTIRRQMESFYICLKSCDQYLEFVFMTGISRFSELSIFSCLNNVTDISMYDDYAAICGITEQEMMTQMSLDIDSLAWKLGLNREDTLRQVKMMYDGYHFTWPSPDIYNPYSLLKAFSSGKLDSYWFTSGTPSYLLKMMDRLDVKPSEIGGFYAVDEDFDSPAERMTDIAPLFYLSGYLTIKGYDLGTYLLDIPNREIRMGLYRSLLPNYVGRNGKAACKLIRNVSDLLQNDMIDKALRGLQTFFAMIPYVTGAKSETHYQQQLITVLSACGIVARLEERTSKGRIDLIYDTTKKTYIMELKLDRSAEEALKQINERDYALRYSRDGHPVVKVGINFSSLTRTFTDWIIEE